MPERALDPLAVLERRLRMLAGSIDAEWGIYVRFLDRGDEIGVDADRMIDIELGIKASQGSFSMSEGGCVFCLIQLNVAPVVEPDQGQP